MLLQGIAWISLILMVSGCGEGKDQLDLPAERPEGQISGTVMNGSFRNAEVNVYSLDDLNNREHLGKSLLDEAGNFSVKLQAADQAILLEVSGGSYQEIENQIEVDLIEGQVLTAPLYYSSAGTYQIDITSLTHLVSAFLLYQSTITELNDAAIDDGYQTLSDVFQIDIRRSQVANNSTPAIQIAEFSEDKLYQLFLAALSRLSMQVSEDNETDLFRQFNSISLSQIMYDDLIADGKLNGYGNAIDTESLLLMQWGKEKIGPDFYRMDIASSFLHSSAFSQLATEDVAIMQQYAHQWANNQDDLFVFSETDDLLDNPSPTVYMLSDLPMHYNETVDLDFVVGGFRAAKSTAFYLDDNLILQTEFPDLPKLQLDTTQFADGGHEFKVNVTDMADFNTEKIYSLGIDNTPPVLTVKSNNVSKSKSYRLSGSYEDEDASLFSIVANDVEAVINNNNEWFVDLQLLAGSNEITIETEDDLSNRAQYSHQVFVDLNAPLINTNNAHSDVKLSLGNGTYRLDKLQNNNSNENLYLEIDKLALQGIPVNKNALDEAGIPYFHFSVSDPTLEGVATPLEDIIVSMRFEINQMLSSDWLDLVPENAEFIIPLSSEYLGLDWENRSPDDEMLIRVRATDKAGNESEQTFSFRASFYVPEMELAVIEDNEADQWTNTTFQQRGQLNNSEFPVVAYQMVNTSGKTIYLKADLASQHLLKQQHESVQRENLVVLKTTEEWRVGTISNIAVACPESTGTWNTLESIWNYTLSNGWIKQTPSLFSAEPEYKLTDNPEAPGSSVWQPMSDFDDEFLTVEVEEFGEILAYQYDYIAERSIAGITQPALLKNWQKTNVNLDVTLCADISQFEHRFVYTYESQVDYPKNTLSTHDNEHSFNSFAIRVYDEDGTELLADNGWVEIPPLHHIKLRKFVKTPERDVYDDTIVATPDSVSTYTLQNYDKEWQFKIDKSLHLNFIYNPLNVDVNTVPQKPVVYPLSSETLLLKRN